MTSTRDRARGALIGLATGDALGTTVEFKPRGSFPPVTAMTGGGPFGLEPGQFTDDTSMALCLAESLSALGRFDVRDQLTRYVRWWRDGHLSATGRCFDIGGATRSALTRFEATGGLVDTDDQAAGNGSLMRLAPAALFARGDEALAAELAARSSLATHGAPQATDSCRLFAVMLTRAVAGASKQQLLEPGLWTLGELHPEVGEIARGSYLHREPPEIKGSGYVVRCLEAALWAFARTDTFADGCLLAVNLGDDADTTGAVYGQIAGAFYGESGIPAEWREQLALWETLDALAEDLARWQTAAEAARLPDLHAYWVEPGVLIAGEYPGARSEADAERKLVVTARRRSPPLRRSHRGGRARAVRGAARAARVESAACPSSHAPPDPRRRRAAGRGDDEPHPRRARRRAPRRRRGVRPLLGRHRADGHRRRLPPGRAGIQRGACARAHRGAAARQQQGAARVAGDDGAERLRACLARRARVRRSAGQAYSPVMGEQEKHRGPFGGVARRARRPRADRVPQRAAGRASRRPDALRVPAHRAVLEPLERDDGFPARRRTSSPSSRRRSRRCC